MRSAPAPAPSTSRPTRSTCGPRPCREHVQRDLAATPEDLLGLAEPEAPEGTTLVQHAEELERKLVALGPVNPLALEELSTLEERHKELEAQVDDVRGARRELHEVVRTLDHEIMTSFAAAAADVNEHFSTLVGMLFPGGTGRLVLTEPDDLLNTGVEIEVRPAGRNVRRVSLLSGGERSMAALAFLFAVFRSRPSPFYLMDEVEAALDDVNLSRFLALVHEFRDEAQLFIVSHQKRTMETGDALYGVTMAPGGSSQVVSQKVERGALAGMMAVEVGFYIVLVVVVAVLGLVLGGVAATRSRRRGGGAAAPTAPPQAPPAAAAEAPTAARTRTRTRGGGTAVVPQPSGRGARAVQRCGVRSALRPHRCRHLGLAGGGAHPGRRRRRHDRPRCWTSCGPRSRPRRSRAATTCSWRSGGRSASSSRPGGRGPSTSTAARARPTCGSSSGSTGWARRRRSARWPGARRPPAALSCWRRGTPSAPPPPTSSACGPSAPVSRSSVARREPTPAPSCSTPCSVRTARGNDLVLADTAGRLHTKVNLVEELKKIRRVADRDPGNVTEVLLVLDATTGQNGLAQAREFADAVDVTGIVLTKLDGTAKGGIVIAVQRELFVPVKLVGLGEGPDDLVDFDPDEFVDALLATD